MDDVFVIVMFTAFTGLEQGGAVSLGSFVQIPVSIVLGLGLGFLAGVVSAAVFKRAHIRDSAKVIILLSISFLMITLEYGLKGVVPVPGLLGVMAMGGGPGANARRGRRAFARLILGAGVSDAGRICLYDKERAEHEGACVLYDRLLPQGHGAGRHRLAAPVHGSFLRPHCPHCRGACDPYYRPLGAFGVDMTYKRLLGRSIADRDAEVEKDGTGRLREGPLPAGGS